MKNVELLKDVLSDETYAKVVEESKESPISLADISGGDYVSKAKYDALDTQLQNTQNLLTQKTTDFDTLKEQAGDNATLKATIDTMKADHEKEIGDIKSQYEADKLANDTALYIMQNYKPKDVSDVMRHVDMKKVSRNGDTLIGVKEQVDAIKESKGYYFESDDNDNNGGKGGEGGKPAGGLPHGGSGGNNTAALRAAFGITDKK